MTTAAQLRAPDADELLVVVGPTASGKSALAMAIAERFNGEIVGADSIQIYRHFDMGSGKPSALERDRVRHHLVDCIDPHAPFDARRFITMADAAISDIRARGRTPVVCGGTFLWVKALLHGLAPAPPADPSIRAAHQRLVDEQGRAVLHAMLAKVDARCALRLAPNDFVRVSRALEVFELSGKPISVWQAEHAFTARRYRARFLRVERERTLLDERIRARTADWLARGWSEQVKTLLSRGYGDCRAMKSVGFRQLAEHIHGEIGEAQLEDAIVRATRKFARRQRTWLRDLDVTLISPP